jgi:hypothetical protein
MPTLAAIFDHPNPTPTSGYRYQSTPKHHGADRAAAQWLPNLTLEEEFAVFEFADEHNIGAANGYLYGVQPDADGGLRDLGTWTQQMAEFPPAKNPSPWHGYPIWAVNDENAPSNRASEEMRPPREVFRRLVELDFISLAKSRRLNKGNHI